MYLNLLVLVSLLFSIVLILHHLRSKKNAFVGPRIIPVDASFKWNETKPRPIRPFNGKKNHRIAMGVSNLAPTPEDWLLIEDTYLKNVELRKSVTENYPKNTVHIHDSPETHAAAVEFYDKTIKFLTDRYPQYFIVKGDNQVYNTITKSFLPDSSKEKDVRVLFLALAANIEEDFLILMKDDPKNPDEEYKLRASITGFPAGFDPSEGFNKPISFIHKPVPQYPTRLKFSMAKFFNKLEPQDLWVRHNWSIQTHTSKFSLANNHAYGVEEVKQLKYEDIDFENSAFLRVERQILSRLPKSRANFMTVRTYFTPLKQIKDEGLAEELCEAIDGLPEDLAYYKRRPAWGEAVKQYLRE